MALTQGTVDLVVRWLVPVFPQLSVDVITKSVRHPSNQVNPVDEQRLLQNCIDDLLELRTFKEDTAIVDFSGTDEVIISGIVDDTAYTPLSAANDSPKQSGDSSSQPIEIEDSLARAAAAHNDSVIYVDSPEPAKGKDYLHYPEKQILEDIDKIRTVFPDAHPLDVRDKLTTEKRFHGRDPVPGTLQIFKEKNGCYLKTKDVFVPKDKNSNIKGNLIVIDAALEGPRKASGSLSKPSCTVVRDGEGIADAIPMEDDVVNDEANIQTVKRTYEEKELLEDIDKVRAQIPDALPNYVRNQLRLEKLTGNEDPVGTTVAYIHSTNGMYYKTKDHLVPEDKGSKGKADIVEADTDAQGVGRKADMPRVSASLSKPSCIVVEHTEGISDSVPIEGTNNKNSSNTGADAGNAVVKPKIAPKPTIAAEVLKTQKDSAKPGSSKDQADRGQEGRNPGIGENITGYLDLPSEPSLGNLRKNLFPAPVDVDAGGGGNAEAAGGPVTAASASKDGEDRGRNTEHHQSAAAAQPKSVLCQYTEEVCCMFPDVDPTYVRTSVLSAMGKGIYDPLAWMVNHMLENTATYPRKQKQPTQSPPQNDEQKMTTVTCPDYFKEYSAEVSETYKHQCRTLLEQEFRRVPVRDIRQVLCKFNHHYAATHYCLEQGLENAGFASVVTGTPGSYGDSFNIPQDQVIKVTFQTGEKDTVKSTLLKQGRQKRAWNNVALPELQQEIEFVINKKNIQKEDKDRLIAQSLNQDEYEASGQGIECGCCYGEYAFESMIQCYEGHLFCKECLGNYAKEAVFGEGKAALSCMSDGCDATFPKSQLVVSLPSNVLAKYEDRCQEEAINLAGLDDLVRCPMCDFAALMDPGDKVFKCQNISCRKETCRYCKQEWEEHFGKPCSEVEKKDETKLRLSYEEKMTMAKIRQCHRCKASFTKSDGCNKMTCRCGAKMCYICRVPVKDYSHFCNHPKSPGKSCKKCKACSLWTNPDEDDNRAVKEIQKEAQQARKDQGFEGEKAIGAPDEPQAKKQKTHHNDHPQNDARQQAMAANRRPPNVQRPQQRPPPPPQHRHQQYHPHHQGNQHNIPQPHGQHPHHHHHHHAQHLPHYQHPQNYQHPQQQQQYNNRQPHNPPGWQPFIYQGNGHHNYF